MREHTSTIVFVNNRRSAERVALRLNELAAQQDAAARGDDGGELESRPPPAAPAPAPADIARAHHGSLAREERTKVEELLKAGELPVPRRHQLARARHRHGRRGPGPADRVAEVGRPRAAAHRTRRARRRRGQRRAHLPQVPRRPARVRGRRPAHARRADRAHRGPAQRARRARAADRRDRGVGRAGGRDSDSVTVERAARARQAHLLLRRALARAARERARHARRALPVEGVRRAARAHRLGPCRRHDPRAQGIAPAGDRQRRARSRTAGSTR